jgi:hypothetical protein
MINLKVLTERNLITPSRLLAIFLALASVYACEKKAETPPQTPQINFSDNEQLIRKFPRSILSVADFLNHWESGQNVSSITEEPETSTGKLKYTIELQSPFNFEKKVIVFADFIKELNKKYHYLQFLKLIFQITNN